MFQLATTTGMSTSLHVLTSNSANGVKHLIHFVSHLYVSWIREIIISRMHADSLHDTISQK